MKAGPEDGPGRQTDAAAEKDKRLETATDPDERLQAAAHLDERLQPAGHLDEQLKAAAHLDEQLKAAAHLDEQLKAALEPPAAAVERVVRHALDGSPAGSPAAGWRRHVAVAAAGAALLVAWLVVVRQQRPARPAAPAAVAVPAAVASPAAARGAIEIRSAAGIVTARSPSGRLWIVGITPRHAVAGSIIVVRRGGNR